ncbi:MAG: transcription antitermination factor NusB [bacterium]|nr:MAG: transcription antitermination factor NusB [bacterium]
MGARRRAREAALQTLYRLDINPCDPQVALDELEGGRERHESQAEFARDLVMGAFERMEEIDGHIREAALKWNISRMAVVDRNVLRLATYEMLAYPETPARVIINEAIEMAKGFGGEESGTFVNGVLDRIRHNLKRKAE